MAEAKIVERKSPLALALEARERKLHVIEVGGFFGLGDKPVHRLAVRVNTKAEQDSAIVAAHAYVADKTKGPGSEMARADADLLTDAKAIEAVWRACRDPDDPRYPAFTGGPQWMREHMSTDQIAVLLNLVNDTAAQESPLRQELTAEHVGSLAQLCADHAGSDVPAHVLATLSHEGLASAFTMLALLWAERSGRDAQQDRCATEPMSVEPAAPTVLAPPQGPSALPR